MFRSTFAAGIAFGLVLTGLACGLVGCACAAYAAFEPLPGSAGMLAGAGGIVACFRAASEAMDCVKP